jgi:hypothetical protein
MSYWIVECFRRIAIDPLEGMEVKPAEVMRSETAIHISQQPSDAFKSPKLNEDALELEYARKGILWQKAGDSSPAL